jgi:hypothetical protein
MAGKYLIVSDETYYNLILPDAAVVSLGLPLVITDEDGNEEPHSWTLEVGLQASPHSKAGPCKPIIVQDPEPPITEVLEGEQTDWVCPINNMGGSMDQVVMDLAELAGVEYHHIALSTIECQLYLKTGELPI